MRLTLAIVLVTLLGTTAYAQSPREEDVPRKDHRALSLAMVGGVYAGFTTWAYFAWYDGHQLQPFEVGGDGLFGKDTYAGGADKLGHFTANLAMTRETTRVLEWGGWKPLPASLIAASLSSLYFFFIEVKDGYYYEFSPGDLGADVLGAAFGAVLENWPALDRRVDLRLEYFPSKQYRDIVAGRSMGEINNLNTAEDYTGQKYLLAYHLGTLSKYLSYVDAYVGFHTEHYRPIPSDPMAYASRHQDLSIGISLNAQALWDRFVRDRIGHDALEVLNVPFTSLDLSTLRRSAE